MKAKPEKVSFDTIGRDGVDVSKALALIAKKLGRGNQADGIRQALLQTAEHIRENAKQPSIIPTDPTQYKDTLPGQPKITIGNGQGEWTIPEDAKV